MDPSHRKRLEPPHSMPGITADIVDAFFDDMSTVTTPPADTPPTTGSSP
jgi:hypothetical protein